MKKRKKLIKRIGAVLCALVVAVGCMRGESYYATSDVADLVLDCKDNLVCESSLPCELPSVYGTQYNNYILYYNYWLDIWHCYLFNSDDDTFSFSYVSTVPSGAGSHCYGIIRSSVSGGINYKLSSDSTEWEKGSNGDIYFSYVYLNGDGVYEFENRTYKYHSSSIPITIDGVIVFEGDEGFNSSLGKYNPSLGYLQNVRMNTVFDDVPLGENVGETYTTRWYYDQFSTTGIDLTNGDYFIRYYQERWIVKGYGEDDVVEKSDRYILGDFIVQNGYIETYSVDVESTLHGQGYEEPSFIDLLWNKFVTTHYYFQIVDAKNNEVGGLLHIYLTDDNGKFGVEHISETLDNEGNYDDSGYKDFIDEDKITSDDVESGFNELEQDNEQTLEEWFEDFSDTPIGDIDKLEGSEAFSTIFRSYVLQVASVSSAVGAIFALLPAWVLGLLGISFVLLFILILLNES